MKCLICSSQAKFFFSKKYDTHYREIMSSIGEVHYWKCVNCGFVLSKTHADLDKDVWLKLNADFHHHLEDSDNAKIVNQPPYAEQAMMLSLLSVNGLIDTSRMLDYAGGYGTLCGILQRYFQISLPIYDPFITASKSKNYVKKEALAKYNTVINSAMFEHILTRDDLEELNNLVSEDGVLILHTVICENVPKDSSWFYLEPPVHTAFHTNKSMHMLMQQWGYSASLYCPQSKCWVLFKNNKNQNLQLKCAELNDELQSVWFHYKQGFMDYWKGF